MRPITAKIKRRAKIARQDNSRKVILTQEEFDLLCEEMACSLCVSITLKQMFFAGCNLEITE